MKGMFLTGCDKNTEWQLPWFLNCYFENNNHPIMVADFGMSKEMIEHLRSIDVRVFKYGTKNKQPDGWFRKPRAIYEAAFMHRLICWLDTDCEVVGDISDIFKYYKKGKLGMVEDRPWTKRKPNNGTWYNSGVVLTDHNWNLWNWLLLCEKKPVGGDQEILHYSLSEIQKIGVIEPLPHKYNTLRLDYIDGINIKNPLVIHHTGEKGNNIIRKKFMGRL